MGKTTLWRAAVEHAEALGLTVLQAQPVESETTLSYAGIGDLLDPVLEEALEPLPAVQQRALSRALVLSDDEGLPLDARALRVAVMNALRTLAEQRPVVIAIDDSQWLDFASSAGLAYGVRRFRAERIGLLLSRRSGLESALLDELLRSPAGERFARVPWGRSMRRRSGASSTSSSGCRSLDRCLPKCTPRPVATRSMRSRSCACSSARVRRSKPASPCRSPIRSMTSSAAGCLLCPTRAATSCSPRRLTRIRRSRSPRLRPASSVP